MKRWLHEFFWASLLMWRYARKPRQQWLKGVPAWVIVELCMMDDSQAGPRLRSLAAQARREAQP